ncbi:MAG: monofunctional biosynthetic peptidoglycan transglycosylase [Marinobacter sp.]|uniref:monofunctional biosynthetic peptidoglycan transglycosylase n=1 Tax=Marinobacter sp. TaxID=50741 RepID=UPI0029C16B93|nr:monofunctional biosynthetic peptidoglycan transglycosylase [Marinobacter sp.]MDX5336676.1 monofunctional biosynthetic peptidoglycan transglycosylase [Marinobacter sp.]MDX5387827.1 monofunctional biosynthetic peptidoglycan transglycosylase [Marinobacter sp.]MDX5440800.1 monofunctional biosynthetic peptidoglycan transglycosylase [Alteromonadaceae bacterium]MDX5473128.1 monofunctional biosynthetic peptidoglycan transglycosylase [Marinobacter sp.]
MAKRSFVRTSLRLVAIALGAVIALLLLAILLFRFMNPPTSAFMLTYQLDNPPRPLRHEWVPLSDISPWMPLAVVASEDQRFPHHRGVDVDAIRKAVSEYKAGEGLRGASTITQQTAKNLFLWNGRSFARKAIEAGLAVTIDGLWPKQRVLEVYLNIAEFGPGIYGVEAASQAYFGKPARYLSQVQAARLAAVLPNPKVLSVNSPSAYVQERVDWIQRQMAQLSGLRYLEGL